MNADLKPALIFVGCSIFTNVLRRRCKKAAAASVSSFFCNDERFREGISAVLSIISFITPRNAVELVGIAPVCCNTNE
jgi:hypothetical protein